ncbi:MAG: zinc ribbon domain-containing protein [Promethearchaeota archaeon]|nr:MAG: zinc ribbon domain-containing protein [Candidatus Lokiarchaeota archaeon]
MSISDLEMKWINFTKNLRIVGVLLIFVMIPYLAFVLIPIQFILTMVALRDISSINRELNDPYLKSFRSRYITAGIIKLIGSIIVHVGAAMIATILFLPSFFYPYDYYYSYGFFFNIITAPITVFIIGFVFMIIGSGVEVGAWDNLKLFVFYNKELFPEGLHYDTTSIEQLRTGALLWALGFLFITIIIGWILQLIGYFNMSKVAKGVTKIGPDTYVTQDFRPISPPAQEPQPVDAFKFCPMCGASVAEGASYCVECGVKIVN